jgi:hypothetical protein
VTRWDELRAISLEGNFPTEEDRHRLLDEHFFQRAIQTYLGALPAANMVGIRDGSQREFGSGYNILPIWKSRMDAQCLVPTPNADVVYAMSYLDLNSAAARPAWAGPWAAIDHRRRPIGAMNASRSPSNASVGDLDELQSEFGEWPCLDSIWFEQLRQVDAAPAGRRGTAGSEERLDCLAGPVAVLFVCPARLIEPHSTSPLHEHAGERMSAPGGVGTVPPRPALSSVLAQCRAARGSTVGSPAARVRPSMLSSSEQSSTPVARPATTRTANSWSRSRAANSSVWESVTRSPAGPEAWRGLTMHPFPSFAPGRRPGRPRPRPTRPPFSLS